MRSIRIALSVSLLGIVLIIASCSKKDEGPKATVKFTTTTATYAEDAGTVNVGVTLSAAQSGDVLVYYSFVSPDTTAFLGGDFSFASTTTSPITIKAGETTGNITINIIDDLQLDGDNSVRLTLTKTGSSAVGVSSSDKNFNLTISDNDVADDSRLQIDLYWFGTDPSASINTQNLDIYLMQNVTYHDSTGVQYVILDSQGTVFKKANAVKGFETLFLEQTDLDQKYFIYIPYAGGTGAVNFVYILNGMGNTYPDNIYGASFAAGDAPPDASHVRFYYWGPFAKNGDAFSQTTKISKTQFKLMRAKQYLNAQ